MGSPILRSVLRRLSEVYDFKSGGPQAPSEFETSLPIQPVQDLSLMAGRGAAVGPLDGWWIQATEITHVATGTITFDASMRYPAAVVHGYPPIPSFDPAVQQCWVYDGWVFTTDSGDFSHAAMGLIDTIQALGPIGIAPATTAPRLIYRATTTQSGMGINVGNYLPNPVPLLVAPFSNTVDDAWIRCISVADNLGTVINGFYNHIWLGPWGTRPPQG